MNDKAIKLGMRLPSYLKKLNDMEQGKPNFHERCIQGPKASSKIHRAIQKANQLMRKGDYQRVVNILEKLLDEGTEHSDIFYLLGESRRLLGDSELSENYLLQCLSMKVHTPHAYYSIGQLRQSTGDYPEAIQLYRHFLSLCDHAGAHFDLGKVFLKTHNFKEAVYHFTQCLRINPEPETSVLVMRADAYEKLGMQEMAQKDYREVLRVHPDFPEPYVRLAEYLETTGDKEQAFKIRMFVNKLFS